MFGRLAAVVGHALPQKAPVGLGFPGKPAHVRLSQKVYVGLGFLEFSVIACSPHNLFRSEYYNPIGSNQVSLPTYIAVLFFEYFKKVLFVSRKGNIRKHPLR
jgi:hypothetical protein